MILIIPISICICWSLYKSYNFHLHHLAIPKLWWCRHESALCTTYTLWLLRNWNLGKMNHDINTICAWINFISLLCIHRHWHLSTLKSHHHVLLSFVHYIANLHVGQCPYRCIRYRSDLTGSLATFFPCIHHALINDNVVQHALSGKLNNSIAPTLEILNYWLQYQNHIHYTQFGNRLSFLIVFTFFAKVTHHKFLSFRHCNNDADISFGYNIWHIISIAPN